jgi:hypothetical protein
MQKKPRIALPSPLASIPNAPTVFSLMMYSTVRTAYLTFAETYERSRRDALVRHGHGEFDDPILK